VHGHLHAWSVAFVDSNSVWLAGEGDVLTVICKCDNIVICCVAIRFLLIPIVQTDGYLTGSLPEA